MDNNEIREIPLDKLVPFSLYSDSCTYKDKRLKKLMNSIKNIGLTTPIIVRPISDSRYEIICGHNRMNAVKELGYDVIKVDIKTDLSDETAVNIYYDSNANPESFAGGNYSRKFEIAKYIEKLIKENSQQGRRNDLKRTEVDNTIEMSSDEIGQKLNLESENWTEVNKAQKAAPNKSGQKLGNESHLKNTRDKMAHRLGIATSTLSKYRSIIKLPDDALESIAAFLDKKKITFEVAYRFSQLNDNTVIYLRENKIIYWFIECINEFPNSKIDMKELKTLSEYIDKAEKNEFIIIKNHIESVRVYLLKLKILLLKVVLL